MSSQCPSTFRFPCIRPESGKPGLTAAELAAVLAPFLGAGTFSGALVSRQDVPLVIPMQTATDVPLTTALYDTDSYFSAGAPTRLTIPSGVAKVVLVGSVQWAAQAPTGTFLFGTINKNGATFNAGTTLQTGSTFTGQSAFTNITSAPVAVVAGDFFELSVFCDVATTVIGNPTNFTFLSCYRVDDGS